MKSIKTIEKGRPISIGTAAVQELLPNASGFFDPFLVFHHANNKVDKDIPVKHQGVSAHPHRGFSPVSFIYKGGIHHRDSRGNDNIVYAGGTQWMHAGMGIVHSEGLPEDILDRGDEIETLQIWINSPAKNKMDQPTYHYATEEDTPTIVSSDGLVALKIPAGNFESVTGNIPTLTVVTTIMGEAKKGGSYQFSFPATQATLLYVLSGSLLVNNQTVVDKQLVLFGNDGDTFNVTATEDTRFFVASGEPINEPIEAHGPFVMNNQTQILEAFRDYQMGKMGILIVD